MEYLGFWIYKNYIDNSYSILSLSTVHFNIEDVNTHYSSIEDAKIAINSFINN